MDRRMRRLAYRVANIIRQHGPESQEAFEFASEHPISMRRILERLKKDNDEIMEEFPVKPLLGPGDQE